MRIHPLITKSEDLKELVDRLSKHPFIAVDTEFMRENTYWPDLCLIQVASIDEAAAIDPKAEGINMKPLLDLFVKNEDVLKVFRLKRREGRLRRVRPQGVRQQHALLAGLGGLLNARVGVSTAPDLRGRQSFRSGPTS